MSAHAFGRITPRSFIPNTEAGRLVMERIADDHVRPFRAKHLDNPERGRLTSVIDFGLEAQSQHADFRPIQGFAALV